jgi:hypothetical protein
MRARIALLGMSVLVAACAGNGEGLDENGRPAEQGDGEGLTPEFTSIQANVLTPICTTCHSGAAAPLGLRLDEGVSYALLVNAPSTEVPSLLRVDPGNPDNSYLIQKLEGTAAVGARMPLGGSPLPPETIAVVRQWILEGAIGPEQAGAKAPSLSSAWPVEGAPLTSNTDLVIAADRELDASLLSAGTVMLMRSGGDAEFTNGNEVIVDTTLELRSLSPTVIALRATHGAANRTWVADTYRLRVSGEAPLAVADLNSIVLDGDADGTPGGDFELTFSVEQSR